MLCFVEPGTWACACMTGISPDFVMIGFGQYGNLAKLTG